VKKFQDTHLELILTMKLMYKLCKGRHQVTISCPCTNYRAPDG